MPARLPTDEDRLEAIRLALSGVAGGAEVGDLARQIEPLHPKNNTFPGEVFLELAADVIDLAGVSRAEPLFIEELGKYLPDRRSRGRTHRFKSDFAIRAAALIKAGVRPDLLEDAAWWRADDFWFWALEALQVYARAAADRTGVAIDDVCRRLASAHGVQIDAASSYGRTGDVET